MTYEEVIKSLEELAEPKYREFHLRISKTRLPCYGVRVPALERLAKRIRQGYPSFIEDFFARSDYSYEEVLLCGMSAGSEVLKRLIPRMDCWAHVDLIVPRLVSGADMADIEGTLQDFEYLKGGGEFERRAYVVMLMTLCKSEECLPLLWRELPTVPQGPYYVDMAIAWLLCETVTRFYDEGVRLLSAPFISPTIRKKAISKCRDSFRLTQEQKSALRFLCTATRHSEK